MMMIFTRKIEEKSASVFPRQLLSVPRVVLSTDLSAHFKETVARPLIDSRFYIEPHSDVDDDYDQTRPNQVLSQSIEHIDQI